MGERAAEARRNRGREGYTYGSSSNKVESRRNSAEFTQQLILWKVKKKETGARKARYRRREIEPVPYPQYRSQTLHAGANVTFLRNSLFA